MSVDFAEILTRNIFHVCFGEDLSDEKIHLNIQEGDKYVLKIVSFKQAIFIIID